MSIFSIDLASAAAFIAAWLLFLGAAVGSFLNVVVYRVPAGMSISWPGSHCPACRHPIRWFDNLPIVSWLVLRGRCRDCRQPISIRYPLVELATATLFGMVAIPEILRGGLNLPERSVENVFGRIEAFPTLLERVGIFGYHMMLLCTLLAAAIMIYDGKRPPGRLFLPAILVGLIAPIAWPWLHRVAAFSERPVSRIDGAIDGAAGLAVGILLGGVILGLERLSRLRVSELRSPTPGDAASGLVYASSCVGAALGWQAVCVLMPLSAAIGSLLSLLTTATRQKASRIGPVAILGLGSLGWILVWSSIAAWF